MVQNVILYPSYYDTHSSVMDEFEEQLVQLELTHYASWLLEKGLQNIDELECALQKAITAMNAAHLATNHHFKKIFICCGGELKEDWLVSDLALRLIMMNADVSNPVVARLQIEVLSHPFPTRNAESTKN
jgi:hypothetical protein